MREVVVVAPAERLAKFAAGCRARLERDVRSLAFASQRARHVLGGETKVDVAESATCADLFRDWDEFHGPFDRSRPTFYLQASLGSRPNRLDVAGVTLSQALDLFCWQQDCWWDTDGETIFVGDAEVVTDLAKAAATREGRRAKYPAVHSGKLLRAAPLTMERVAVAEAPAVLARWLDLPVKFGPEGPPKSERTISIYAPALSADVVLDILTRENGLKWRVTEEGVTLSGR